MDKDISLEVAVYLVDAAARPDRLAWAQTVLPGNPVRLGQLLAILRDRRDFAEVKWARALAAGDPG